MRLPFFVIFYGKGGVLINADVLPLIKIALLWICWCFLHSLLISRLWTGWLRSAVGDSFASYRLLFNIFSLATVSPIVLYQFSLEQRLLFNWSDWWQWLKILLYFYVFYMFYVGWKRYDMSFFLGIKQMKQYLSGVSSSGSVFSADCAGGVRHPWYSGGLVLVVIYGPVTNISLVSKIVLGIYLVIGTLLEERKLLHEIGEPYATYCRQLPMLFPRLNNLFRF